MRPWPMRTPRLLAVALFCSPSLLKPSPGVPLACPSVSQSVTQMRRRVCCSFYSLAIWPTMWRSLAQGRHSAPVTVSWGQRCGPTPTSNVARLSFHFVLSLFFIATQTYNSLFVAVQNYRLPHYHLFRIFFIPSLSLPLHEQALFP